MTSLNSPRSRASPGRDKKKPKGKFKLKKLKGVIE